MKRVDATAQRALILTKIGRDSAVAQSLLREVGVDSVVCRSVDDLVIQLKAGAAMALVAEEAVQSANITKLADWLGDQPSWSDFPIILLSVHGGGPERNPMAQRWAQVLGNVTVIERPFHPTTLAAAVSSAARARYRQYEARARADALHESEQRLRTALSAAALGTWSMAHPSRQLTTSPACRTHFGFAPDADLPYDDFVACIHADDLTRVLAAVEHALISGDDYAIEYRTVWPDGSVHWIDVRGTVMRDEAGVVTGLSGVTADISGRKSADLERENLLYDLAQERAALSHLNATLEERVAQRTSELMREVAAREQAQEQLRQAQKMESIGQLTGGVAHDFNNLLMAVMAALNLLRKRVPETPQTKSLIQSAIQAAERGASLTQRLLAFARQQDLQTRAVEVNELVLGMRDLLERSLGPRFQLVIDVQPGCPAAEVDANQLELAILNLVINARDAMPDGGQIKVEAVRQHVPHHDGMKPGTYCAIRVADTGTGMDEATLKKAVEPFFSTKAVGKGTGLGLSMVHGLAVQLGGGFKLDSALGQGTTATIFVPFAGRRAEHNGRSSTTVAPAVRSARVLVVDDDPLVASLTASMLDELGHSVIELHSGREALELLRTDEPIDLMMTDYLMPAMTGMELAAAARELRPHLAILLATGFAELTDSAPVDMPRITKPYGIDDLRDRLAALPGFAVPA